MKTKFNLLEGQFVLLTKPESAQILGGVGIQLSDDDLQKMFYYTTIGGFDSDLAKLWNSQIRLLAESDVGSSVLQDLLSKAKENTINRIELTKNNQRGSLAFYEYDPNTGCSYIDIDRLQNSDLTNIWEAGNAFHTAAHEIFHAYKSIVKGVHNDQDATREIDANLFAAFSEKQIDQLNGSQYYRTGAFTYVDQDVTTASEQEKAFQLAWDDIVTWNDFSLLNYNRLIVNFQGSLYNQQHNYDTLTCNQVSTFLNYNEPIYNLFYGLYGVNNNSGGSGTPGSGGGGDQNPGGMGSGYTPGVNDGSFYWGTSVLTTPVSDIYDIHTWHSYEESLDSSSY